MECSKKVNCYNHSSNIPDQNQQIFKMISYSSSLWTLLHVCYFSTCLRFYFITLENISMACKAANIFYNMMGLMAMHFSIYLADHNHCRHLKWQLLSFVCVPQTDTSLSYLVVDTYGRRAFFAAVRRSGAHYLINSQIRRAV